MVASTSTTKARAARRLPVLAAVLLAAGCSGPVDFGNIGSGVSSTVDSIFSPFSGNRAVVAADSLTAQRVRGSNPAVEPLLPESGNVWPEPETPRPTLLSGPDEAMRNIPTYRPSLVEGAPAAASPVPSPGEAPPQRRRRGSSTQPAELGAPVEPPRAPVSPGFAATPPARSGVGSVTTDPSGRPAVITNEAGRVRGFSQPGVGGGAVVRDGNVETWIGPDGQARTRVVTP